MWAKQSLCQGKDRALHGVWGPEKNQLCLEMKKPQAWAGGPKK